MKTYVDGLMRLARAEMPDCDGDLLRLYSLLALVAGSEVSRENVHDAWSLWRSMTRPDHPAIIPFEELSLDVQNLDQPYVEAIQRLAAKIMEAPEWGMCNCGKAEEKAPVSTLETSGGWGVPGDIPEDLSISKLLELSDEELAAYAETQRGGEPCQSCDGTGLEHQPCGCPYCEGVKDEACWWCDGMAVEPDHSSWYTRENLERLQAAGAKGITFEMPVMSVKRGGIQFPIKDDHV